MLMLRVALRGLPIIYYVGQCYRSYTAAQYALIKPAGGLPVAFNGARGVLSGGCYRYRIVSPCGAALFAQSVAYTQPSYVAGGWTQQLGSKLTCVCFVVFLLFLRFGHGLSFLCCPVGFWFATTFGGRCVLAACGRVVLIMITPPRNGNNCKKDRIVTLLVIIMNEINKNVKKATKSIGIKMQFGGNKSAIICNAWNIWAK